MAGALWGQHAAPSGPVVVRTYRGSTQSAAWAFQRDAAAMASAGYSPVSQQYVPGSWGAGPFLLGVVALLFFGLGILVLAYLLIVKPDGTLSVTYAMAAPQHVSPDRQSFPVAPGP